VTRELAAAREEIQALKARTAQATAAEAEARQASQLSGAEQQKVLEREREKADAVTRELAAAREEIQALEARLAQTTEADAVTREEARPAQTTAAELEAKQASQENSQSRSMNIFATESTAQSTSGDKLINRAEMLTQQGNISAARAVLQRALDAGSLQATFLLAETYDPRVLTSWGVHGTQGNPAKARELYKRAYEGGVELAKQRIEAIQK
jgi:hypothetical protein